MSDWWSYRPADFLMFAPGTYWRLFELYNEAIWPGQAVALATGLWLLALMRRGGAAAPRMACALLAAGWLWVAWAFVWQRYATINWAAAWFAAAFALQALLLAAQAWRPVARAGAGVARASDLGARRSGVDASGGRPLRQRAGAALLVAALLYPLSGRLLGRPWTQAEVFGLAPDPTALGTLGVLLWLSARGVAPWWLWPIPLLWCAVSGATLWTMQAPGAMGLPALALLAAVLAWRVARR